MHEQLIKPLKMNSIEQRLIFMIVSLLLDYPVEEKFSEQLATIESQVAKLSPPVAANILKFTSTAKQMGLRALQEHYVETFDQKQRCSLFLTYYAVGDTRQRGTAILAFRETLQALGFELEREELPDHLCVVLEAVALVEEQLFTEAIEMLSAHRDGIEILRAALEKLDSPYLYLLITVCQALPQIDQPTIDSYLQLLKNGPPSEMVGLQTPLPFPTTIG